MAEYSGLFNQSGGSPAYTDQLFAKLISLLAGSEGYVINYLNELEVTLGDGLEVKLSKGAAFLGYGDPGWYYINDAEQSLVIDPETTGFYRIDRIVLRVDRQTTGLAVSVVILKGNEAADSPGAPNLSETSDVYELSLAQVYVTGGSTVITITDERKPAVRSEAKTKTITDGARTLKLSDNRKIILASKTTPITYTVPASADVNFPIGAEIVVIQYGVGAVTLAAASGVIIVSGDGYLSTATQYKGFTLIKIATDEWLAIGTEA